MGRLKPNAKHSIWKKGFNAQYFYTNFSEEWRRLDHISKHEFVIYSAAHHNSFITVHEQINGILTKTNWRGGYHIAGAEVALRKWGSCGEIEGYLICSGIWFNHLKYMPHIHSDGWRSPAIFPTDHKCVKFLTPIKYHLGFNLSERNYGSMVSEIGFPGNLVSVNRGFSAFDGNHKRSKDEERPKAGYPCLPACEKQLPLRPFGSLPLGLQVGIITLLGAAFLECAAIGCASVFGST